MSRPLDLVLSRLQRARKTAAGWRAPCPACGPDSRSLKLAVTEGDDGRVLLHCFAGCGGIQILASVGLSLADLFERPAVVNAAAPEERHQRRLELELADVRAAAAALDLEAVVLEVAAEQISSGQPLNPPDRERLALAHRRIADALLLLRAAHARRPRAAA